MFGYFALYINRLRCLMQHFYYSRAQPLDMKREAISKIGLTADSKAVAVWRSDASILKWLESL